MNQNKLKNLRPQASLFPATINQKIYERMAPHSLDFEQLNRSLKGQALS